MIGMVMTQAIPSSLIILIYKIFWKTWASYDKKENLILKLSTEEINNVVLKKCDKNKSPGLDGLPYEFYQATWNIIGQDFVDVLQVQLERLNHIESDRNGATRLTSKVGDNEIPGVDELRPITVLNSDYKILSKAFVGRLVPVMPQVIMSGQLCSV